MATATLSTGVSRRSMIAGAVSAAVPSLAVPATDPADARLAALARAYWRTVGEIHALIDEAERRHGVGGWMEGAYAQAYGRLAEREARTVAAIAATPPGSIVGLATKMRVATLCHDGHGGPSGDILETVFHPALADLDRLAAEAARL